MTDEIKDCPACGAGSVEWHLGADPAKWLDDRDKEISRLREALYAWVIYDERDFSDDTTGMIATYNSAIAATRAALGYEK